MYAALGKKAVLQGLFRSSGNKRCALLLLLLLLPQAVGSGRQHHL
jgi:hypothetical protein